MTTTEQEWLGNPRPQLPAPMPRRGYWIRTADNLTAGQALRVITEAELIKGMKQALKPFRRPTVEPKQGWDFPRAGIRRRPDGRYQLRIWLDPLMTPDPVQGGACETIAEAYDLGAMICHYARQAAA